MRGRGTFKGLDFQAFCPEGATHRSPGRGEASWRALPLPWVKGVNHSSAEQAKLSAIGRWVEAEICSAVFFGLGYVPIAIACLSLGRRISSVSTQGGVHLRCAAVGQAFGFAVIGHWSEKKSERQHDNK